MKYILIIVFLALTGCSASNDSRVVLAGMSKQQVIEIEGVPDEDAMESTIKDNYALLLYLDQMMPESSKNKADRTFVFQNDTLIEYTVMNIRPKNEINSSIRLNAKQRLALWLKNQDSPQNPSATAGCIIEDKNMNCFDK